MNINTDRSPVHQGYNLESPIHLNRHVLKWGVETEDTTEVQRRYGENMQMCGPNKL